MVSQNKGPLKFSAIGRGDLRSAGISCFIAKPLRSYRSPSLAPESFGRLLLRWRTILGYYPIDPGCFTKDLGGPVLAWLLHRRCQARCCLRPRGVSVGTRLNRTFRFACAYYQGIGTFPKFSILGAMGQIQSIHSSPRLTRLFSK